VCVFITAVPITKLFEDLCNKRRRAEACVNQPVHHALVTAGERDIVRKEEGEKKGSARGSVQ
jgi:hypothetical protein